MSLRLKPGMPDMKDKPLLLSLLARTSSRLAELLQPDAAEQTKSAQAKSEQAKSAQTKSAQTKSRRAETALICAVIFFAAFAIRQLHWQDYHLRVGTDLSSLVHRYQKHAKEMLDGEGLLLPRDYSLPKNVQLLVHPPGYSIFIAAIFGLFGDSNYNLVLAQILLDALAAALVSLIAAQLLPRPVAITAGLMVAFSPHLARQTLMLLPDSLVAAPTLLAVYFIVKAIKRPRLVWVIAAGLMAGLSCWLRSNALLLALFLAVAVWLMFDRDKRTRFALALVAATMLTIAPITIRNWAVFGHFIPLSLGSGITMVEGIADYDKEKRYGMPANDGEGKWKDVEWHNRPDYAEGLWRPDGIERDKYRFARGLQVMRDNPVWFAGVMIRRAGFMLRYNDSRSDLWPTNTARSPIISAEPQFGHAMAPLIDAQPVWSIAPSELLASGETLSPEARLSIAPDGQSLEVKGDASSFADQFASAPLPVEKNTDYVLRFDASLVEGLAAAKVTSADRRITLASAAIEQAGEKEKRKTNKNGDDADDDEDDSAIKEADQDSNVLLMPFASGDRTEARLVISNNGSSPARPSIEARKASLYEFGATPHQWTRYARPVARGIQRNLYTTSHLTPLVAIGIILLAVARRFHALVCSLAVPAYYLCAQSAFHTEYRYIIAIHYFLFVMASVALYVAGASIWSGARRIFIIARRSLR
jgi:dolichyl-phosphate-mannose-protein mannosyltransferase